MRFDAPHDGCSLSELVLAACDGLNPSFNRNRVCAEFDFHDDPTIDLDPKSIVAAVSLIIEHAIQSTPPGRSLLITTTTTDDSWEIEVADGGEHPPNDGSRLAGALTGFRLHQVIRPFNGRVESCACPQGGQAIILAGPLTRRRGHAA